MPLPRPSKLTLGAGLGPLSNRPAEFQNQTTLVLDQNKRPRFAAISRRVLALPHEILAEIFIQCLPNDEFIAPSPRTVPLLLCSVCRQWRMVALTNPKLWRSLDIRLAGTPDYIELYQNWLSRAANTPLSISLHASADHTTADSPAKALFQTIVRLSPQWRNVDLTGARAALRCLLPEEGRFPLLAKLTITHRDDDYPISFLDAPNLREVHALQYLTRSLRLPWSQLTLFRADEVALSCCLEVLRHTSNLVNATLHFGTEDSPSGVSLPPLIHLRSLTLCGPWSNGEKALSAVLDSLTVPALKTLTLRFPYNLRLPFDISPFVGLSLRSSFQLQTLVLYHMPTTTEALIQCLKVVPSIVHLKIGPTYRVDMKQIYTRLARSTDFLPKLESFHAIFTSEVSYVWRQDIPALLQMLPWRWAAVGVARLRSFQLAHTYSNDDFDETLTSHSQFLRLVEQGMELYVGKARPIVDSFPNLVDI
ncbi:hypothetical protein DFH07DRAFT_802059 [Mycena maculata]|uniref:F-box domain-containing protein n=1 Tax=Mycena maculata TaxID=230809 RepID=A0AAD7JVZ8_9AGAR|nr:hypothetical protein DFH07DRAFT_802059 [Mycena maculata]